MHWAAVHWIALETTAPARHASALNARILTITTLPESGGEAAFPGSVATAEPPASVLPAEAANRATFTDSSVLPGTRHYFSRDEVDVPAEPVSRPPLLYPERAFMSGLSGKVRVRVFINESGKVDELEIVEVIPEHQPFADSAAAALRDTVFSPATIKGRRVKNQRLVEVVFSAQGDSALENK